MVTPLENEEDLNWAKEVHGLPSQAKYAIFHGNEDAPSHIEWWPRVNPTVNDRRFVHQGEPEPPTPEGQGQDVGEDAGHGMLISELLAPPKERVQRVFHDRRPG